MPAEGNGDATLEGEVLFALTEDSDLITGVPTAGNLPRPARVVLVFLDMTALLPEHTRLLLPEHTCLFPFG